VLEERDDQEIAESLSLFVHEEASCGLQVSPCPLPKKTQRKKAFSKFSLQRRGEEMHV
jgi:hypothetical protein